jgi:4-carboxymuconolactone decarboxylase
MGGPAGGGGGTANPIIGGVPCPASNRHVHGEGGTRLAMSSGDVPGGRGLPSRSALRQEGEAVVAELGHGTTPPRPRPLFSTALEGMGHYTAEALWGAVWTRPGLSRRHRLMVTLSVLTCLQRLPQLRTYLNSSLNTGLEPAAVAEVLVQCSVFAGFPVIVNGLELFREVLEARGVAVEPEPVQQVPAEVLDERGARLQAQLSGASSDGPDPVSPTGPAAVLAAIERRYVYGEIFHRPGLTLAERTMCALASVVALGDAEEQAAWKRACGNAGLDPETVDEVVLHVAHYAGFPAAHRALREDRQRR